ALIVYQKPNLLLLDEPTNHLDSTMREALVYALQDFEGAMVIVAHDRHLLRTTVDEFYLVANQQVQPFAGDLDAYHDWLQQQASQAASSQRQTETKVDRKAEKRKEAEQRQALKPLKDQINRAEKRMAEYEQKLTQLNEKLADTGLYEAARKAELTDLLQQQAELQKGLAQAEAEWLEAEEALQEAQAN
ncbi:ABC transporter ATP-binding protein, partial [Pseudidiomarina aestuarii]